MSMTAIRSECSAALEAAPRATLCAVAKVHHESRCSRTGSGRPPTIQWRSGCADQCGAPHRGAQGQPHPSVTTGKNRRLNLSSLFQLRSRRHFSLEDLFMCDLRNPATLQQNILRTGNLINNIRIIGTGNSQQLDMVGGKLTS